MFDGTFVKGDLCNFKITNPVLTDLNDVMYLRLEYFARCRPVLIKGESLQNPIAMYQLNKGQDYTALRGINFYLLFISEEESSGDFVFRIWFNQVNGYGKEEPTEVTYEISPQDPEDIGVEQAQTTAPKNRNTGPSDMGALDNSSINVNNNSSAARNKPNLPTETEQNQQESIGDDGGIINDKDLPESEDSGAASKTNPEEQKKIDEQNAKETEEAKRQACVETGEFCDEFPDLEPPAKTCEEGDEECAEDKNEEEAEPEEQKEED